MFIYHYNTEYKGKAFWYCKDSEIGRARAVMSLMEVIVRFEVKVQSSFKCCFFEMEWNGKNVLKDGKAKDGSIHKWFLIYLHTEL